MSVPGQVNDGNWSQALQSGTWRFTYPFQASRNDSATFEAHRTMTQDWASYTGPAPLMTGANTTKGVAYMLEASPTVDIGGGLLQWEETFGNIPATQNVNGSIVYSFQFLWTPVNYTSADNPTPYPLPDPPSVGDITKSVAATINYQYSLSAFEPISAPRVGVLFDRVIYKFGGYGTLSVGQVILAEDSVDEVYKAGIHVQKQIKITVPAFST